MNITQKLIDRLNKYYANHYASHHDGASPTESWGNSVLDWYARHFMHPLSVRGLGNTRQDLVDCFYWYQGDRMLKQSKLVSQVREAERKFVAKGTQHLVIVICVFAVLFFGLVSYLPWGPSQTEIVVHHLLGGVSI